MERTVMVQGDISSFSSFYFSGPNVALPLQLLSFTGSLQNNVTLLKWVTTNEINISHFVIERSINGIDFIKIGSQPAKGNNNNNNNYTYNDYDAANQMSSIVYYRLKIVDVSGSFSYSQIVSVKFASFYTMLVHPNPVQQVLYVHSEKDFHKPVMVELYDLDGKILRQQLSFKNDFTIDVSSLKQGVYVLKMYNGYDLKTQFKKIIKL